MAESKQVTTDLVKAVMQTDVVEPTHNIFANLPEILALDPQVRAYVYAYVGPAGFNAIRALKIAGFPGVQKTLSEKASLFMRDPAITNAINACMAFGGMNAFEVITRLSAIARGGMEHFITNGGYIDINRGLNEGFGYMVRSYQTTPTRYGVSKRLELHNSQAALEVVGKVLGMYTERSEVTAHVFTGDIAEIEKMAKMEPDELIRNYRKEICGRP